MQAALSLLGLLIAAVIWREGHPVLAVIVGILLVGGAGWMLPIWLARGIATSRVAQPKAHARLDALLIGWRARFGAGSHPPVDLSRAYLDGFGTRWQSPAQFLDYAFSDAPIPQELDADVQLGKEMYAEHLAAEIERLKRDAVAQCRVVALPTGQPINYSMT